MEASSSTAALPPDETRAPMLLGMLLPLLGFTLVVYAARIWFRISSRSALTAADYVITVAMVSL